MEEIINKVANSGLITINLEEIYPAGNRMSIDVKDQLWQGLALREKDFREFVKSHDWEQYRNSYVSVFCSADAIVPTWAYMLVASKLSGVAKRVVFGTPQELEMVVFQELVDKLDLESLRDGRIIVKGCSDLPVPISAYVALVERIQPVARSIMFGEPCSTVPVFKR
jgi:Protein of unknown function (DUF2480)